MVHLSNAFTRTAAKVERLMARHFEKRAAAVNLDAPIISFSFDDAPQSAYGVGRDILRSVGARATYFVSLGLLDSDTEVGKIGSKNDLEQAVADGCELGCHTFDHLDSRDASVAEYIASIERNSQALQEFMPGATFRTFAYPKNGPTLAIKAAASKRFDCCRSGGQEPNAGVADLNLLKSVFLDRRTGIDAHTVQTLIDDNASQRGWLIFSTHDVVSNPTRYGCTPDFLETVARRARDSGAALLTVAEALARVAPEASRV